MKSIKESLQYQSKLINESMDNTPLADKLVSFTFLKSSEGLSGQQLKAEFKRILDDELIEREKAQRLRAINECLKAIDKIK